MNPGLARILDANANRAREALRVLEDYARFVLNDQPMSADLKSMRHNLAAALGRLQIDAALLAHDTTGDVGVENKTPAEFKRESLADVIVAAGKRLSEALRVLEETGKILDPAAAAEIERLRYRGYTVEQILTRIARQTGRFSATGVYVLLTEAMCRLPWEQTLDAVLAAGASVVQLREKTLSDAELLRRASHIAQRCREHNALAIINDRPDIALLAQAHGVHVGQTDLPPAQIRQIIGHELVLGVSTENMAQAQQAVRDGASYIAVGPMFPTTTKEKPRLAGPAYAAEAIATLPLPCVAIGGITAANVPPLRAAGVRTIAVCSYIISDADPGARTRELLAALAGP